ncbi:MAG: hypothetical protein LBE18_03120, partial [Planctomycetaceae bacterium]|nr:hypothetical protein [Planctomycetaceae bacterium]
QKPKYPYQIPRYLKNGHLDVDFLMRDFQQFWRVNSGTYIKQCAYTEAAPHLVLMAFLQRVINGGGRVSREMAAGSGRLDLLLEYNDKKYPIELKIRRSEQYIEKGLKQIARYMDIHNCKEGWLAVFDKRKTIDWDDKIYTKKKKINGKTITIVGL